MAGYTLTIAIDDTSLTEILNAKAVVVITRTVGGIKASVAWLAFTPWPNNLVTWLDSYAVYASTTPLSPDNILFQNSSRLASPATAYSLEQEVFNQTMPKEPLGPGTYEVINNSGSGALAFGLSQAATINANTTAITPLFAQSVLQWQWLDLTPDDTVTVFLQAGVCPAMVMGSITSPTCRVVFSGAVPDQAISFNPITGGFQITDRLRLGRPSSRRSL